MVGELDAQGYQSRLVCVAFFNLCSCLLMLAYTLLLLHLGDGVSVNEGYGDMRYVTGCLNGANALGWDARLPKRDI